MAGIKAIIFDLDGTLIDSAPDLQFAANRLMRAQGQSEFDLETIAGFIGNGIPKLVERAMRARDMDLAHNAEMTTRFKEIYEEDPTSRTIIFDHVPECLSALRARGYKIGLCTNKAYSATEIILRNLKIGEYFDVVIGGDTTAQMKPDPLPLQTALSELGVASADAIYVGDSAVDFETARAADIAFAFYDGGYCHGDPAEIASVFRFDHHSKLMDWLASVPDS